jgi:hypothetical protein
MGRLAQLPVGNHLKMIGASPPRYSRFLLIPLLQDFIQFDELEVAYWKAPSNLAVSKLPTGTRSERKKAQFL